MHVHTAIYIVDDYDDTNKRATQHFERRMCREHHSCNHHGGMFQDRTNQPTNQPTKTKSTLSIKKKNPE
ncbi:hypothetical protein DERF_010187 [Dermatophagoides farinae]|uniref:Uncharacterized protein n=1 Tax=Dermatophagoides farinae TaxID=6954 RepID=A0A922HWN7_DERFA|nr:hypothetical protein DERF_010187 [Dermatophagoides farinae]